MPPSGTPETGNRSFLAHGIFLLLFATVLFATHWSLLDLPYFWDELGQFIPAALDIYYDGALVPKTTLPNVHPPGLMLYLAGVWKIFGYSVVTTRAAMLLLAGAGVFAAFQLAVHLCRDTHGLPAFGAVLLMMCSPLFFTQSFMAQLDMPAMVFTILGLYLFLTERMAASAVACVVAVLMKETAITTPAVFGLWLVWERRWREALYFVAPAIALGGWLLLLKSATGHWLGNKEFTHYNVWFQFHPVRMSMTVVRRVFYLLIDNFHIIGAVAIWTAWRRTDMFRTRGWKVAGAVFVIQTLLVSVFGGAALERYLMPILPLFYIACAAAFSTMRPLARRWALGAMAAGLVVSLGIPAVFPYPYENNLAVVDFVRLQQEAAELVESQYQNRLIGSAWPFPDSLRRPEFGYVQQPMRVKGLANFDAPTVLAPQNRDIDVLVLYSRTWEPGWSVIGLPWVKEFLKRYYFYSPQVTGAEVQRDLGLLLRGRVERRGQWIEIYARPRQVDEGLL